MAKAKTKQQLTIENEELRARLQEMEDTLDAIRSGSVDAIVTSGPAGEQVYTLEGADHAYQMMVESMNEGALTLMMDGTILYVNRQFGQMTGTPSSEIVGRRFHDFVSATDHPIVDEIVRGAGSTGVKTEIRLIREAAPEIPVRISTSPIDLSGMQALTFVVTDLSDQKRLEDIVAAEKLSQRILDQAQEGIAVCIDGHIVRANNSLYRICGKMPLMQPFDDIFAFETADSERFSVSIPQSGTSIRNEEVRYRRPDGTSFDLILSAGPLFGSAGEVLGCLVSLVDVTGLKQAEREIAMLNRELRQKIRDLEAIFETVPIGLAISEDPDGLHIRGNPANERMLGVTSGGEFSKRSSEPGRYRVLRDRRELGVDELPMQLAVRGETVSGMILDVVREDGRSIKLLSNASPLPDEQGRPRGAVGAFLDITELARTQEALRESEERYRVLLNTAPDAIVVHRDGQFLFANDAALRLYGAADFGQLQSRNIVDLVHADDCDATRKRIRQVQSGERSELRQARLLRLDGGEVPVEATAAPVDYGGERAIQVILRDVTQRREAERALEESEERYRSLFDSMTEGFAIHEIITDAGGRPVDYRFLDINPSFERLTGLKREDLIGRLLTEALPEEDPEWISLYGKVALTGEPLQVEKHSALLGRWYQVFAYRPAPRQFAVIFMDVTGRRRLEDEARRLLAAVLEEKDRLAALISSMNDEVWLADTERNFQLLNPRAMQEFGLEDSGGIDIEKLAASLEVYRPDGTPRPVEEAPPLRALRGEEIRNQEEIVRMPSSGALRYREVNSSPVRDAGGNIIGSVSVCRDITDRKRADDALRRSEARFRLLSETAAQLLASGNPQGLIESLCRQVMEHLDCQAFFNFMVDEHEGRLRLNACAGIPEEEIRKLAWLDYGVAVCGCVARDGVRIIAEDIFHTPDVRTELVKSYGIQAYCCHPMKAQDRLLGTLSFGTKTRSRFTPDEVEVMRTVADQVAVALQRIEAQQEIFEASQRLQMALDAGGMGTWTWDLRSNGATWNPKMYDLLGLPAGKGVEDVETFYRLVHPEDLPGMREAVRDALARAGLLQREFRVVRPDGKVRWLTTLGRVRCDEAGQPLSMTGVVYDFTSHKEREEELRKLNRMLRALSNSSLAQARAEEEAAYLEEICRIVVRDCGYAMVWIGYAESDEDRTVRPVAHAGFEDGYLGTLKLTWADRERGRGPTGTAIREARAVICPDMLADPRFAPWREEAQKRGYASSLALPLMSEGTVFGAVTIYSDEPDPFSPDEVVLLTELAEDLSRGIMMLRLKAANREAQEALQRSKNELEVRVRERTAEISLLLEEVEKSRDALRRLASELVMAEEQERKRIAVTLHDEVAQTLAAAKMRLDMLKSLDTAGDYDRVILEIRNLLAQSIRETRSLMTDISSPVLYDMGLAPAVQAMADQASADSGIVASYLFRGDLRDLQIELAVMIYHVVKELLQNVIKHSGARSASIRIAREDTIVRTVVADDGRGFETAVIGTPGRGDEGGFGLFSIRERVKSFDGDLQVESAPGKGTVVTVTLPVRGEQKETRPEAGAHHQGSKKRKP